MTDITTDGGGTYRFRKKFAVTAAVPEPKDEKVVSLPPPPKPRDTTPPVSPRTSPVKQRDSVPVTDYGIDHEIDEYVAVGKKGREEFLSLSEDDDYFYEEDDTKPEDVKQAEKRIRKANLYLGCIPRGTILLVIILGVVATGFTLWFLRDQLFGGERQPSVTTVIAKRDVDDLIERRYEQIMKKNAIALELNRRKQRDADLDRQPRLSMPKKDGCPIGDSKADSLFAPECSAILPSPSSVVDEIIHPAVPPCDNFFEHACGLWNKAHANASRGFGYLNARNHILTEKIVLDPSTGDLNKVFRSCVSALVKGSTSHTETEVSKMEADILGPLEHIEDASRWPQSYATAIGRLMKWGIRTPIQFTVEPHPYTGRLALTFKLHPTPKRLTFEKVKYVLAPITLSPSIARLAWAVHSRLTEEIAADKRMQSNISLSEYIGTSWMMKRDTVNLGEFPSANFDMITLRQELGIRIDSKETATLWFVRGCKDFVQRWILNATAFSRDEWNAYYSLVVALSVRDIDPASDESIFLAEKKMNDGAWRDAMGDVFDDESQPTETECIRITKNLLPGMMGKEYLQRYSHGSEIKSYISNVVSALVAEFIRQIDSTPTLSGMAKTLMSEKLKALVVQIPDASSYRVESFTEPISSHNYIRNLNLIRQHRVKTKVEMWNKYALGDALSMEDRMALNDVHRRTHTVNAWYSPNTNTFTLNGAILTKPFYDILYDSDSTFAGIGFIIARGLANAVGKMGILYDGNGIFTQWLPKIDTETLAQKYQCVEGAYLTPYIPGCEREIGAGYSQRTLDENIADMVALKIVTGTMKRLKGQQGPSGLRQFFYAFAQNWCESNIPRAACNRIASAHHALMFQRVNTTLRNTEEFSETFGCSPVAPMKAESPCNIFGR